MGKLLPKSRLGRGLSSLMSLSEPVVVELPSDDTRPTDAADAMPRMEDTGGQGAPHPADTSQEHPRFIEPSIDLIVPNPHQPRRVFDEEALKGLAESLKTTGLIQPVVARATNEGKYELIAGERRWRAARLAGFATLPVLLRKVDAVQQAQMALVENLQRQDLNPLERASAYKAMLTGLGFTQAELADRLSEDRTTIAHHLRLLELAPVVQNLIRDGVLTLSHARLLGGLSDTKEQARLAELCVSQELSLRNLERLIAGAATSSATDTVSTAGVSNRQNLSAHLVDLERQMARTLGMRVQVKASPGKKKGRLILHYSSLDQFDELMSRLGIVSE